MRARLALLVTITLAAIVLPAALSTRSADAIPPGPVNATVLQGKPIAATAPADGQLLKWVAGTGKWTPATVGGAALSNPVTNAQGGTGQNSSAWTGVPTVAAGVWSINSVLPVARGGTNAGAGGSTGAVAYWGAGSAYAFTNASDSANKVLHGNAAGAPTWSLLDLAADVTGALPATSLSGTIAAARLSGSGAPAGGVPFGDFTGGPVAEASNMLFMWTPSVACSVSTATASWLAAGVGGATGVVIQMYDLTAAGEVCHCTLGACTVAANTAVTCTCVGTIPASHTVVARFTAATDCATNPTGVGGTFGILQ